MNSNKLLHLFVTFFKIGAFTFGGGYAMIPLIQKEVVDNKGWLTNQDILDIIAIAESTPGPIAVNSATFVGYKVAGVLGSTLATLGVVLPSFVIILLLSFVISQFENLKIVKDAFWGIRIGVLALIVKALITMFKQCPKNIFSYILLSIVFVAVAFFKINIVIVLIVCAISGLIYQLTLNKINNNKNKIEE